MLASQGTRSSAPKCHEITAGAWATGPAPINGRLARHPLIERLAKCPSLGRLINGRIARTPLLGRLASHPLVGVEGEGAETPQRGPPAPWAPLRAPRARGQPMFAPCGAHCLGVLQGAPIMGALQGAQSLGALQGAHSPSTLQGAPAMGALQGAQITGAL